MRQLQRLICRWRGHARGCPVIFYEQRGAWLYRDEAYVPCYRCDAKLPFEVSDDDYPKKKRVQ